MRRIANLLLRTAAVWFFVIGFVEPSDQAFAQNAPPKVAAIVAQEDLILQHFEQQFGAQFRQLQRTELHFMRLVCQPTKQQYEKISAESETPLKATVKQFAVRMNRPPADGQSDPRASIADAIAKSVRTTLSPEQAARYQRELEQRAAAHKRAVLLNLVVKVDKVLVLTTEQRGQLSDILDRKWSDSWNQTQMLLYGGQHLPQMPDADILSILTEAQKVVWRSIPKANIRFGFNLGIMQGIEIEEEIWKDDRLQPEPANAKAAKKEPAKPMEKK